MKCWLMSDRSRPVVALVGRPNVGKSTLLNRLLGRRHAIVEEYPGVTRDRNLVETEWRGVQFLLADTGGWLAGSEGGLLRTGHRRARAGDFSTWLAGSDGVELAPLVSKQAEIAVDEADLVLMIADATVGVTEEDAQVASMLKHKLGADTSKRVVLVANKVESPRTEALAFDLVSLGLGEPILVSALHGTGSGDLLDIVVERLSSVDAIASDQPADNESELRVVIVGRPNVGKSTLFNKVVGQDRAIVSDVPGTTRDVVDTVVVTPLGRIRFLDTAGMRRRARIGQGPEYYSFVRTLSALDSADVALLVIDASEAVTHQDRRLAERIKVASDAVIVVLNKWDLADVERRGIVEKEVADQLSFIGYAPVLKVSALTGKGIHKILPALSEASRAYASRVSTGELNRALTVIQQRQPPRGGRILYGVQGASDPPTFTLFTTGRLDVSYMRFLEKQLRDSLRLGPTPLKIRVRKRGDRGV